MRRAIALDPLSAPLRYNLGIYLTAVARYDEAEASMREAVALQPQGAQFRAHIAITQSLAGKAAQAIEMAKQEPDEFWRNYALAIAYYANGNRSESDDALAWLIKNDSDDGAVQIATIYAQRKQADETFRWFEHAMDTHDGGVTELYTMPFLITFRDDPRFAAFAKRIGLPPLPADALKSADLAPASAATPAKP